MSELLENAHDITGAILTAKFVFYLCMPDPREAHLK
jgi:hypothetical protein